MTIETAKFSKRVFSYLIDFIISFGLGAAAGSLLFLFAAKIIPWYFSLLITLVVCYILYLLINAVSMLIFKGYTLGSAIFGIRIVSKNNQDASAKCYWIKCLYLGLIPFVVANAIYMLIVHTEQTIFDRITDTVVIDTRNVSNASDI